MCICNTQPVLVVVLFVNTVVTREWCHGLSPVLVMQGVNNLSLFPCYCCWRVWPGNSRKVND